MNPFQALFTATVYIIKYSSSLNAYHSCDGRIVVNDLLTAVESTTVSVTGSFSKTTEFTFIERKNLDFSNYTQWCLFSTRGAKCTMVSITNHSCNCDSVNDLPVFKRNVFKSDSSLWKWRWSYSKTTVGENIIFNILEAVCVTNLEMNGLDRLQIVDDNIYVLLLCLWGKGNRTSTVRLLKRNAHDINSNTVGTVTYSFDNVSCSQAGITWCMTNFSTYHTSVTFLRNCSPEFGVNVTVTNNETLHDVTEISTTVRMYTSHITRCQLSKYSEQDATRMTSRSSLFECSTDIRSDLKYFVQEKQCHCHVSGTPPDLIFKVFFYNASRGDTGNWRLAVSNQVGNGYFNFSLHLGERSIFMNEQGSTNVLSSVVGTVTAVTSVAAIISIIAVLRQIWNKKYTQRKRSPFIHEYAEVADSKKEMRVRHDNSDRQGIKANSCQAIFPIINLDTGLPANYTHVQIGNNTL